MIGEFVDKRKTDRLGLVVYAGRSYTQCPLTMDYGILKQFLKSVNSSSVSVDGTAIGSAIMVLVSKNPIHSVLWLILVFFAISGHYILLNAQFLAIVNIIVYAGAIMVLFLFVIMLINVKKDSEPQKQFLVKLLGVLAGGSFLTLLVALVKQTAQIQGRNLLMKDGVIGLIHPLGKALFTDYVVPFEISSILFLSAMVGAVIIGKK